MGNVINFPNQELNIDDLSIEIERTEDFNNGVAALTDYIKVLPLNNIENDQLIDLIINQIKIAEKGAFLQGFDMGLGISKL